MPLSWLKVFLLLGALLICPWAICIRDRIRMNIGGAMLEPLVCATRVAATVVFLLVALPVPLGNQKEVHRVQLGR